MDGPVRIIVVGLGRLGGFHLQKLRQLADVQVVGLVDTCPRTLAAAAAASAAPRAAHLRALVDAGVRADAAIVATPTVSHLRIARQALELGLALLVEKPLCATAAEAESLVGAAEARGLPLQVGHVERFNPAVCAALARAGTPRFIVAERLTPFSGRGTDVDVVMDLMVHDLDLIASLVPAPLSEVRAVGVPVVTGQVDMASARLAFADGTVAQLSAGRVSQEGSRRLRFFGPAGYVSVDCIGGRVKQVLPPAAGPGGAAVLASAAAGPPGAGGLGGLRAREVAVPQGDALALQDADFVGCLKSGRRPRVDGRAGLRAVRLAEAVRRAVAAHAEAHAIAPARAAI